MAQAQHTPALVSLEEAITLLFCLVDDAYALLDPRWRSHESLKKLSDSEVLTLLALFQQCKPPRDVVSLTASSGHPPTADRDHLAR